MRVPKLCYHKPSRRYYVRLDGQFHYLGSDEAEAQTLYAQRLHEWKTGQLAVDPDDRRVCELIDQYSAAMVIHYAPMPRSWDRGKSAMKWFNDHMGRKRIADFSVMDLRLVREAMNTPDKNGDRPLCRSEINRAISAIVHCLKWGVSMKLCPVAVWHECTTLEALHAGRCEARETQPVGTVDAKRLKAVKAVVNASVRAMIEIQELTGARPGEVCGLKAEMIDRTVDPWHCELVKHKTAHKGKRRVLFFGPKAQKVLTPLLLKRAPGEYLFQPKDAWGEQVSKKQSKDGGRREGQLPTQRKTERTVRECYDKDTYAKAVGRGCEKAKVDHWSPNQIRHARATEIRKERGIEAAGAVLGHAHLNTTEIYAEVNLELARKVAAEMG
jgi:integrase